MVAPQPRCGNCRHVRNFHIEDDGSEGHCYALGCKCPAYEPTEAPEPVSVT